jgi:Secretion system C-terminal sorting domain
LTTDLIELETPGFRSDGKPNTVFYDDDYSPMIYTAFSSDSTLVTVRANQNDTRFGGRPSLFYQVQPGAPVNSFANITVIANDGNNGLATATFRVTVVSNVTMNVARPEELQFSVAPNPARETALAQAQAQNTGTIRMKLLSPLGTTIVAAEHNVTRGQVYQQQIDMSNVPAGIYFLHIQDGSTSSIQKIVKN